MNITSEHHEPKQLQNQLFINLNQTFGGWHTVQDQYFFLFPYRLTLHIAFICVQTNSRFAPRGMYIIVESVPLHKDLWMIKIQCGILFVLMESWNTQHFMRVRITMLRNISSVVYTSFIQYIYYFLINRQCLVRKLIFGVELWRWHLLR